MKMAPKAGMVAGWHSNPGNGALPIQVNLDCSTRTTRLMSWSGRTAATPEWRSGAVPAKAEA